MVGRHDPAYDSDSRRMCFEILQADVRKLQESESTQRDEVKQLTRYGVFFEDVLQEVR